MNFRRAIVRVIKFHLILALLFSVQLYAQDRKETHRLTKGPFNFFLNRSGIHTGNLVRTAYSNFGNLGSRTLKEARMEWPIGSGITYGFEFVFWVASEVITDAGDTLHIISDRYTGGSADHPSTEDNNWGWEPLLGFFDDGEVVNGIGEDINGSGRLTEEEDSNANGGLDHQRMNKVE